MKALVAARTALSNARQQLIEHTIQLLKSEEETDDGPAVLAVVKAIDQVERRISAMLAAAEPKPPMAPKATKSRRRAKPAASRREQLGVGDGEPTADDYVGVSRTG